MRLSQAYHLSKGRVGDSIMGVHDPILESPDSLTVPGTQFHWYDWPDGDKRYTVAFLMYHGMKGKGGAAIRSEGTRGVNHPNHLMPMLDRYLDDVEFPPTKVQTDKFVLWGNVPPATTSLGNDQLRAADVYCVGRAWVDDGRIAAISFWDTKDHASRFLSMLPQTFGRLAPQPDDQTWWEFPGMKPYRRGESQQTAPAYRPDQQHTLDPVAKHRLRQAGQGPAPVVKAGSDIQSRFARTIGDSEVLDPALTWLAS